MAEVACTNMQIMRDFIVKRTMHLRDIYFGEALNILDRRKGRASGEFLRCRKSDFQEESAKYGRQC